MDPSEQTPTSSAFYTMKPNLIRIVVRIVKLLFAGVAGELPTGQLEPA